MVLQETDECVRRHAARVLPTRGSLPGVPLTLIQKSPLGGGDELLRSAEVVGVVRLSPPGQCDHRAVMKVIVPQRVESAAISGAGPNERCLLRLVLSHDPCPPR